MGKKQAMKQLQSLIDLHTYRGLAHKLGYKTPASIQNAIRDGSVGPTLALKLHRKMGISLEQLGH